jgi:hypothetical protein
MEALMPEVIVSTFMRAIFIIIFSLISYSIFSQKPGKKPLMIEEVTLSDKQPEKKKKAQVLIVSEKDTLGSAESWDRKWIDHIESSALKIAQRQLLRDSTKITYKVIVQFSINADGSIYPLQVSCQPANSFIVKECEKMVHEAPKKTPVYKNGKYVKTNIRQPIDIIVK